MAELYEYTDPDGDRLRVTRNEARGCGYVTVSKDETDPATVYAPTGEDAVALARAVLDAAGITEYEIGAREMYQSHLRIALEDGAMSMRERAVEAIRDRPGGDPAEAVRALPLLPDGDDSEVQDAPQQTCASRSTFMDESTWRCGLAHDHDAWHKSAGGEREWTDAAADDAPGEDFDAGWTAGHAHASADEARIAELEKQLADLADLVHGHGEDLGQAKADIRGLGKTAGVPAPATAWDRKHLEYFARGGVPVDLDIVRRQLLAVLEQMDVLRSETAKKTQYIREMGRADAGHWFGTPPEAPQPEPDLPDYIDATSSSEGWSFRCGKCEGVFHKVAETDVGARAAVRSHVAAEHGEDG